MPLRIFTRWVPVSMDLVRAWTSIKLLLWHSDEQDLVFGIRRCAVRVSTKGDASAGLRISTAEDGCRDSCLEVRLQPPRDRLLRRQPHRRTWSRSGPELPGSVAARSRLPRLPL